MCTGKTEKPCCLCGDRETVTRLDLPPRAVQSMENAGPIAWRDVVGEVSIHFCASDWDLVADLVLDTGMSPLPRCNVAQASLDIREDFEALLNDVREPPDQRALEERMLADARETVSRIEADGIGEVDTRDAVEAYVRLWALEDADGAETRDRG